MTIETQPPEFRPADRSPPWAVSGAVASDFGTFVVGSREFAITGMLPKFAGSTGLTTADAGYAITAYALGVIVGAPLAAPACVQCGLCLCSPKPQTNTGFFSDALKKRNVETSRFSKLPNLSAGLNPEEAPLRRRLAAERLIHHRDD